MRRDSSRASSENSSPLNQGQTREDAVPSAQDRVPKARYYEHDRFYAFACQFHAVFGQTGRRPLSGPVICNTGHWRNRPVLKLRLRFPDGLRLQLFQHAFRSIPGRSLNARRPYGRFYQDRLAPDVGLIRDPFKVSGFEVFCSCFTR